MTLKNLEKTPWPWFGGKSKAAPAVWAALGDVAHYVEPFAGSLAVLLRRPHPCNRTYFSETVNDADGLLVNAWRSMQWSPREMAVAASWPVSEADMHARHLALVRWREERNLERLMADPKWHDPEMGGWWAWGQSCWIGGGWCSGTGPWTVGDDGRIYKQAKRKRGESREPGVDRRLPHVGDGGRGVLHPQSREPGVEMQRPHLSNNGQGVNRPQSREPGVKMQRPHISDDGQGINHANLRESGVARQLPHLACDGRGVNRPQSREPGVERKLPHLAGDGRGVNRPQSREPGVERKLPGLTNGRGVNRPQSREPGVGEYHPMMMPELLRWFEFLSARLRHVRILNGDWKRASTRGALKTLPCRSGKKFAGVFLDPPYSGSERRKDIYAVDNHDIASEVNQWCIEMGQEPWLRIVLAGFDSEHSNLTEHGWREVEWFRGGFLQGGMGNIAGGGKHQQKRERLWLSPHCEVPE